MESLNEKQKKIIKTWYLRGNNRGSTAEDLPAKVYEKVVAVHYHKALYQNVERYLDYLYDNTITVIDW